MTALVERPRSPYRDAGSLERIPRDIPDWHERGTCRLFPELSWVHPGAADVMALPNRAAREAAVAACRIICASCPVRLACATSALERGEKWGMWGGLDRDDRKAVAARFGFPPPADPPEHGTNARRVKWGCTCFECKAAHARYEYERRQRGPARRRARPKAVVVVVEAAPAAVVPLRLDLAAYRRRTRRR